MSTKTKTTGAIEAAALHPLARWLYILDWFDELHARIREAPADVLADAEQAAALEYCEHLQEELLKGRPRGRVLPRA